MSENQPQQNQNHKLDHTLDHQPGQEHSSQDRAERKSSSTTGRGSQRGASEFQQLLSYALKTLARREHSTVELRRKLGTYSAGGTGHSLDEVALDEVALENGPSRTTDEHINQVIDALVLDGSLSDERFAAEFVRMRIRKGYGPIRIRMDLLERGVPDRLAEEELTRPSEFWQQQAAEVCVRKFGHPESSDGGGAFNESDGSDGWEASYAKRPHAKQPVDKKGRLNDAFDTAEFADRTELEDASPEARRRLRHARKEASQRRWNRCARFLSQRGFPADLIYQTLDGRLLD